MSEERNYGDAPHQEDYIKVKYFLFRLIHMTDVQIQKNNLCKYIICISYICRIDKSEDEHPKERNRSNCVEMRQKLKTQFQGLEIPWASAEMIDQAVLDVRSISIGRLPSKCLRSVIFSGHLNEIYVW